MLSPFCRSARALGTRKRRKRHAARLRRWLDVALARLCYSTGLCFMFQKSFREGSGMRTRKLSASTRHAYTSALRQERKN